MLEDGRSIIQTTGTRRFRMLKKSEKDGYLVANVEWIDDTEDESSGNI
jgi:Lon protease-like protein